MIFYKNRKIVFKLLGSVVYYTTDNYLCDDYTCLQQAGLSLACKVFENTTFKDISNISIPELLMNIMSCNGFVKDNKSTVILSCCRKWVSYDLFKIM